MLITILDWVGTIFILIGNLIITSKLASKPKTRLFAISFYLVSNITWIPFAIMLETYGLLITQILLLFMNIKGIINCYKEMNKYEYK